MTLTRGVLCGYAAMFGLLFVVAGLLIEGGVFEENAGHVATVGAFDPRSLEWSGGSCRARTREQGDLEDLDRAARLASDFPIGTLVVNLTGAFALGVLVGAAGTSLGSLL